MCLFTYEATLLGYIVIRDGIKADESKIEVIRSWPIPHSIHDAYMD